MGMGFAPTWLRQVSPSPLLHKTTLTTEYKFITLRASCGSVYYNRSCLWMGVYGGSITTITRNCVQRSSPHCVCIGKGSDRLQLIKFGRLAPPGKGVCGGAEIFGSALLQPAQCLRLLRALFPFVRVFCLYFYLT